MIDVSNLRIQVLRHLMLCPVSGSRCFEGTWCHISKGQGTRIINDLLSVEGENSCDIAIVNVNDLYAILGLFTKL